VEEARPGWGGVYLYADVVVLRPLSSTRPRAAGRACEPRRRAGVRVDGRGGAGAAEEGGADGRGRESGRAKTGCGEADEVEAEATRGLDREGE